MSQWYRDAAKCYVYLSDVSNGDPDQMNFLKSRGFTRGWTLQELLAPEQVEFFTCEGDKIGDKASLEFEIHQAYLHTHSSLAQHWNYVPL